MAADGPDTSRKVIDTASRLRLDLAVASVFSWFDVAGVHAMLLKGPSLAQWLYESPEERPYLDCDLLVAPTQFARAGEILESHGYALKFDDRSMPDWWLEHASAWVRESDGVTVDLHRTLPGVQVDDETAWRLLSRNPDRMVVGGRDIPTFGQPERALHVTLHAAHHGARWSGPMADLDRALAVGGPQVWRQAAALSEELSANDAFAAGLELTDAGRRLVAELQLPPTRSVEAALRATTTPPIALGLEQFARAKGIRARLAILWLKFVPPPEFIRHWDPRAKSSRMALVRAYLRRPVWLLRNGPRGFSAWQDARRSVRRESRPDDR